MGSVAATLAAARQEHRTSQFLHLYTYLAKERATNQQYYFTRATQCLEEAPQSERDAATALEALATDLAQAKEALDSFEHRAREAQEKEEAAQAKDEVVSFTFEEQVAGTASPIYSPPPFPSPFESQQQGTSPQRWAQLQAHQVQLQQGLTALAASTNTIQSAMQIPAAAPVTGVAGAQPTAVDAPPAAAAAHLATAAAPHQAASMTTAAAAEAAQQAEPGMRQHIGTCGR